MGQKLMDHAGGGRAVVCPSSQAYDRKNHCFS